MDSANQPRAPTAPGALPLPVLSTGPIGRRPVEPTTARDLRRRQDDEATERETRDDPFRSPLVQLVRQSAEDFARIVELTDDPRVASAATGVATAIVGTLVDEYA